jgi:hypothetical protein
MHILQDDSCQEAIAWHPTGLELLGAGWGGVTLWNLGSAAKLCHVPVEYAWSVAWLGECIAYGDNNGNVCICVLFCGC